MVKTINIYLPKVPAFFSIIGSTIIVLEVIQDMKLRQATVISRIILSMSIGDIIYSLGWFIGTWLSPRHVTHLQGTNYGTYGTCVFHGFIQEVGVISSVFMNSSLALVYLLVVKHNFREQALKKLEIWMQVGVWVFALVFGIIPIFLKMYHNMGPICWIDSYPRRCTQSWEISESSDQVTDCTMGDNSMFVLFALGVIPVWSCIVFDAIIMCIIFRTTHQTERNMFRYGLSSEVAVRRRSSILSRRENRSFRRSRMVAQQGILYMSGFLCTYLLSTSSLIVYLVTGKWNRHLDSAGFFFLGSQGIFNLIIFSRLRDMKTNVGIRFRTLFWDYSPCFVSSNNHNGGGGVLQRFKRVFSTNRNGEEEDKFTQDRRQSTSSTGHMDHTSIFHMDPNECPCNSSSEQLANNNTSQNTLLVEDRRHADDAVGLETNTSEFIDESTDFHDDDDGSTTDGHSSPFDI